MVCEALGLGPRLYCVTRNFNTRLLDSFSRRLFLLMQFIPPEKIVLFPDQLGLPLRGPFLRSPCA